MTTSKRSAHRSGSGKTAFISAAAHGSKASITSAPGALSLATLLMIGVDRVIIDAVEDDNLDFMAEYIDPA